MSNICLFNIWPLTVTLTLSWHMSNMGSAHPLVEVNVSFKFEGNPSISKGVIERTRIGDRRTDRLTNATKRIQYSPPTFCGIIKGLLQKIITQIMWPSSGPLNKQDTDLAKLWNWIGPGLLSLLPDNAFLVLLSSQVLLHLFPLKVHEQAPVCGLLGSSAPALLLTRHTLVDVRHAPWCLTDPTCR